MPGWETLSSSQGRPGSAALGLTCPRGGVRGAAGLGERLKIHCMEIGLLLFLIHLACYQIYIPGCGGYHSL